MPGLKLRRHPILTLQREHELSAIIHGGSEEEVHRAVAELVENNMKLTYKIASAYISNTTLEWEDVVGDGMVGLMEAAKRYDAKKAQNGQGKFGTYAGYWIRQKIGHGIIQRRMYERYAVSVSQGSHARQMMRRQKRQYDDGYMLPTKGQNDRADILEHMQRVPVLTSDDDGVTECRIQDDHSPNPCRTADIALTMQMVEQACSELHVTDDEKVLITAAPNHSAHGMTIKELCRDWSAKRGLKSCSSGRMRRKIILGRIRKWLERQYGKNIGREMLGSR